MKLQHNSSGESSEDLIALIIAVRRERGSRKGKHEQKEEEGNKNKGSRGEERGSSEIEELERETDVAGVSRCSSVSLWFSDKRAFINTHGWLCV